MVREGVSEGMSFELRSEGREPSHPQLGMGELVLAQEAANAKALRQNMALRPVLSVQNMVGVF